MVLFFSSLHYLFLMFWLYSGCNDCGLDFPTLCIVLKASPRGLGPIENKKVIEDAAQH